MKDIDFDELDRAVSSVLSQRKQGPEEKQSETTPVSTGQDPGITDQSEANQLSADETPESQSQPGEDTPVTKLETTETESQLDPASSSAANVPAAVSAPLAVKRRGKFMDVMHPSADMQPTAPTASHKPNRLAAPSAPLLEAENDEEPTVTVDPVEHNAEPTAVVDESSALIGAEPAPVMTPEPVTEPERPAEEVTEETEDSQPEDQEPQTEAATEEEVPVEPETVAEQPTATPFLSDTQVEKRPLGAFGEAEAAPADAAAENGFSPTPQASAPTPLPRELQPDVVEVESASDTEVSTAPGAAEPPSPFATQIAAAPEASDGRVEGHPVFDTSTYHEPIAAVHHRSFPGWAKWTIGLLMCLAVGAGVGYFLFTAGL